MRTYLLGSLIALGALGCGSAQSGLDAGTDGGSDGGACNCFSHGKWAVDNLSPCFAGDSSGAVIGVLSTVVSGGVAMCPADLSTRPTEPWATSSLTTNCAGHFRLCLAIKAGDAKNPKATDCVVAEPCAEGDFTTPNVKQAWPPLESWIADDAGVACARDLRANGGYGLMRASGMATGCPQSTRTLGVFTYCPDSCVNGPDAGNCGGCAAGGTGNF